MFFINALHQWPEWCPWEYCDWTWRWQQAGRGTGKNSANGLERKEDSVELRRIVFSSHKQIDTNWEQPDSSLQKQIQKDQAEWHSAMSWYWGKRGLHAEIFDQFCLCKKRCRFLPYVSVPVGSYQSDLAFPTLISQLHLRPTLLIQTVWSSLDRDRPWLPGFHLLSSSYLGTMGMYFLSVRLCPSCLAIIFLMWIIEVDLNY